MLCHRLLHFSQGIDRRDPETAGIFHHLEIFKEGSEESQKRRKKAKGRWTRLSFGSYTLIYSVALIEKLEKYHKEEKLHIDGCIFDEENLIPLLLHSELTAEHCILLLLRHEDLPRNPIYLPLLSSDDQISSSSEQVNSEGGESECESGEETDSSDEEMEKIKSKGDREEEIDEEICYQHDQWQSEAKRSMDEIRMETKKIAKQSKMDIAYQKLQELYGSEYIFIYQEPINLT